MKLDLLTRLGEALVFLAPLGIVGCSVFLPDSRFEKPSERKWIFVVGVVFLLGCLAWIRKGRAESKRHERMNVLP